MHVVMIYSFMGYSSDGPYSPLQGHRNRETLSQFTDKEEQKKKKKTHVGANDEYKQQKFKDLHPLPHPPSSTHTFPFLFYMERIMLCK